MAPSAPGTDRDRCRGTVPGRPPDRVLVVRRVADGNGHPVVGVGGDGAGGVGVGDAAGPGPAVEMGGDIGQQVHGLLEREDTELANAARRAQWGDSAVLPATTIGLATAEPLRNPAVLAAKGGPWTNLEDVGF